MPPVALDGCFAFGDPAGDRGYLPSPSPFPSSSHLLEVTVISAQDLYPAARSMRTFAVVYVHPDHQMRTRLDAAGHTDPSWNDKFVLRIDDASLRSDTSAITIDVYAKSSGLIIPGSEVHIGTARALLSTLRPSKTTRFIALQVRRPRSLRPQGIINIGVALIDAYVRSLPLHAELIPPAAPVVHHASASTRPTKVQPVSRVKSLHPGGDKGRRSAAPPAPSSARTREGSELERKLKMWRAELPQPLPHPIRRDQEKVARPSPLGDKAKEKGGNRWLRSPSFRKFSCITGGNVESGEFVPAVPRFVQERPVKHKATRHAMDWS